MKHVSICIPTYEMNGLGDTFLAFSFDRLLTQTFKDFDVVVSDHSQGGLIKKVCDAYAGKLDIHYFHYTEKVGSSSANINNAIKQATGQLIKILFQDDFLYDDKSLEIIVDHFDLKKDSWLVTGSEHSSDGVTFTQPYYPQYTEQVHMGDNRIGSPSVLTIKNDDPLLFDEKLIWLMDCEYYKRCYDKFGLPKIVNQITVVNRVGAHQVTNTKASQSVKKREHRYIVRKYRLGIAYWLQGIIGFTKHKTK